MLYLLQNGDVYMKMTNGAQTIETYPGKRIIKSGAVGATIVAEVEWLIEKLISLSAQWKFSGWAYIVEISNMSPASPEVSEVLVTLHKRLSAAGCKVMAFVNFASFITGAQAKEHQKKSNTGIIENTFRTEEDALKWIETVLK